MNNNNSTFNGGTGQWFNDTLLVDEIDMQTRANALGNSEEYQQFELGQYLQPSSQQSNYRQQFPAMAHHQQQQQQQQQQQPRGSSSVSLYQQPTRDTFNYGIVGPGGNVTVTAPNINPAVAQGWMQHSADSTRYQDLGSWQSASNPTNTRALFGHSNLNVPRTPSSTAATAAITGKCLRGTTLWSVESKNKFSAAQYCICGNNCHTSTYCK